MFNDMTSKPADDTAMTTPMGDSQSSVPVQDPSGMPNMSMNSSMDTPNSISEPSDASVVPSDTVSSIMSEPEISTPEPTPVQTGGSDNIQKLQDIIKKELDGLNQEQARLDQERSLLENIQGKIANNDPEAVKLAELLFKLVSF